MQSHTLGLLQFLLTLSYLSDWCLVNFFTLFLTILGLLAGVRAMARQEYLKQGYISTGVVVVLLSFKRPFRGF